MEVNPALMDKPKSLYKSNGLKILDPGTEGPDKVLIISKTNTINTISAGHLGHVSEFMTCRQ